MPHTPQTAVVRLLQAITDARNIAPGDRVAVQPQLLVMGPRDGLAALKAFRLAGGKRVADPSRILLFSDDNLPAPDAATAQRRAQLLEAARSAGITRILPGAGCEIPYLLESAAVVPGECAVSGMAQITALGGIGALGLRGTQRDLIDLMHGKPFRLTVPASIRVELHGKLPTFVQGWDVLHALGRELTRARTAGAALEIAGEGLALHDRVALASQAAHGGLFSALCLADRAAVLELNRQIKRPYTAVEPQVGAAYTSRVSFDLSAAHAGVMPPGRAWRPVGECAGLPVTSVVLHAGLHGLRDAAKVIKSHRLEPGVRCVVIPESPAAFAAALADGTASHLADLGAELHPPGTELFADSSSTLYAGPRVGIDGWTANVWTAASAACSGELRHPEQLDA